MYSAPIDAPTSRILPSHRPLAYQWTLHIISGLAFVHSHDVIFGDLNLVDCWLSSDSHLSLSLVGFVNAGFNYKERWSHIIDGTRTNWDNFHPLEHQANPTKQTDLFLYGCTVYELMTGFWPVSRSGICSSRETAAMISRKEWPLLEAECMGEIVHKCWNDEYASVQEVRAAVVAFLEGLGWEIEGDDDLKNFDAIDLFP
jgi:serine/threonine protein kinase